jgi:hypothetical protein
MPAVPAVFASFASLRPLRFCGFAALRLCGFAGDADMFPAKQLRQQSTQRKNDPAGKSLERGKSVVAFLPK